MAAYNSKPTWYSKARLRVGMKMSNSIGVDVFGLIRFASFLAFVFISTSFVELGYWNEHLGRGNCTGKRSATAFSSLFCCASLPRRRYTFSQGWWGYFSCSNSASLRRVMSFGNAVTLRTSAREMEYQSSGYCIIIYFDVQDVGIPFRFPTVSQPDLMHVRCLCYYSRSLAQP